MARTALALLRHREFRLLWTGQSISRLGDQFYLIALPWLVLQISGSPVAMGSVLALEGLPRLLFMVLGGAVSDRVSPRAVILASYLSRFVVVGTLALVVAFSTASLWMIYIAALLFGLADAFYMPAQSVIIPHGVARHQVKIANMLNQSMSNLTMTLGPFVAGATIAFIGGRGAGLALVVDAVSFALGAWLLALTRFPPPAADSPAQGGEKVWTSIRHGIAYVWHDASLRAFVPLLAAISILVDGPFDVCAPMLARVRFPEGAAAFGVMASAFGAGMLAGTVGGVADKRAAAGLPRTRLLLVMGVLGISTACLGLAPWTWVAAVLSAIMGAGNGYVSIVIINWVQGHTPDAYMGRMMSMLMIGSAGLGPFSTALAGLLAGLDVAALLMGSGLALLAITVLAALGPGGRRAHAPHVSGAEQRSA